MSDADARSPELAELTRSSDALLEALDGLDADQLARRSAPGEWSAWDIAYHVAQMEVWYLAKLCEAASSSAPEAMREFVARWRSQRQKALALAGDIPHERLDTPGLLGSVPDWTPRQLLERMAAHDREHTAQVQAAVRGESKRA
jgi:hypothetical protein